MLRKLTSELILAWTELPPYLHLENVEFSRSGAIWLCLNSKGARLESLELPLGAAVLV